MKKKKLLFYFYNRLNDPLLQSNIFQYMHALAKTGFYDIAIVTYEDDKIPLSEKEKNQFHKTYREMGMRWYPLKWHAGSGLHLKAIDIFTGFFRIFYLSQVRGYRRIVTLGSIAGSFVYMLSKLMPVKFYLYQYEPHSEYALDNKIWKANSLQYRLLHAFENRSLKSSAVISSGTLSMQTRLKEMKVKARFFKVASVVNDKFFYFDIARRNEVRARLGIAGTDKLVIYPGKVGELYCSAAQLLDTFNALHMQSAAYKFLVITPGHAQFNMLLGNAYSGLKAFITVLSPVPHHEMPCFLSASDLGVVAVPPGFSKKFMSPIKIGEYLCSGLPYLICSDLEDSGITQERNIGVVVDDFTEAEINRVADKITTLLQEPKNEQAARCHAEGIALRGFDHQYREFKKAIEVLTD